MLERGKYKLAAWLGAALLAITPVAARAAMSLAQAIDLAMVDDPGLAAARLAQQGGAVGVEVARGGYLPQLTASSRLGLRHLETAAGRESLQTSRQALALRQSIYAGGGVAAALSAAKSRALGEDAGLMLTEQATVVAVVDAYLAVLREQALLELAIATERALGQHTEAVRQRYRFGAVTAGDVAMAEARLAAAAATRRHAAGALKVSGAVFEEFIGQPPGELLVPNLPADLPDSLEQALAGLDTHPGSRRARHAAEAAGFEVGVAQAAMRPRLTLEGDAALVDQPEETTSGRQDASIALNLVVPLYQGGVASARTRAARLEAERQDQLREQSTRALASNVIAAWERFQAGRESDLARDRQVAAARMARDSFVQEAQAGERSLMDIIDAESDLLEAQTAAVTGHMSLIADAYRLLAATGALAVDENP